MTSSYSLHARSTWFVLSCCAALLGCAAGSGGGGGGDDPSSGGTSAASGGADGGSTGGSSATGGAASTGGATPDSGGSNHGAGGGDTGGNTGGSDCSTWPICEDFESGIGDWQTKGTAPSVVSDGRSGQGLYANVTDSYIQRSDVFPSATGKLHVRAYMKWDGALDANHVAYMALAADDDVGKDLRFGSQNGSLHFNSASGGDGLAPDPYEYPSCESCYAPPVGEWVCVEVMFDWTNELATLWVGDTERFTVDSDDYHSGTAVWPTPNIVRIGHHEFGGANPVTYDDVVIAYDRIGCD